MFSPAIGLKRNDAYSLVSQSNIEYGWKGRRTFETHRYSYRVNGEVTHGHTFTKQGIAQIQQLYLQREHRHGTTKLGSHRQEADHELRRCMCDIVQLGR